MIKTTLLVLLLLLTISTATQAQDLYPTTVRSCAQASSAVQAWTEALGGAVNQIGWDLNAYDWYIQNAFYLYSIGDIAGADAALQSATWSLRWADNQLVYTSRGLQEINNMLNYLGARNCTAPSVGTIKGQIYSASQAVTRAWQSLRYISGLVKP